MKFIHLSDLHIGKRVKGISMLDDQKYILEKIIQIVDSENPDAIFICGDIYDKSVPPTQAITLFDDFLVSISKRKIKAFIISGNHDSPERISFGSRLMNAAGIYVSPVYNGDILSIKLEDDYGPINIYMLPFIKPIHVREFFPDTEITSYTDAIETILKTSNINEKERNVILTHQFITGSERSESEEISVGGTDNVSACVFEQFDYVALGHIHKAQTVTRPTLRYCGTPLKYSISEVNHTKSVTVINIKQKGDILIETIPLEPLRDMQEIRGTYMDITSKKFYEKLNPDNYFHVTLTDEDDIPYAMDKLRIIYKNIMGLSYDNKRTRTNTVITSTNNNNISPFDFISDFYYLQNNQPLSEEQKIYIEELIEKIWENEK